MQLIEISIRKTIDDRTKSLGLHNLSSWKIVLLKQHPGFLIVRNPFNCLGQRYWIRKCLEEYSKKSNKRNIDIELPDCEWWEESFNNGCNRQLQKKLRWSTLGYHHNWDTKVYNESERGTFPADLAELCDVVANCLGFSTFKAEAAIVNYYHMNSTLSAHTDHSEVNLQAPLLSFSGDIAIMSEEARLCYHAVPRILPSVTQPWNDITDMIPIEETNIDFKYGYKNIVQLMNRNIDEKEWSPFNSYVGQSRINVNVRQVLKENQTDLRDCLQ
ncbi:unnamed protein product [Leptidea sinapis]|uniref:Alpha-ketoglutarate-dependent dioxygenase AlkB-like domain-containing protein n=1 Tax=Leptidea sinapis TaxID=189913 RepID=A0A5E4QBI4_9NEOP|nr:unnamed protein product [Leptidea sinapis]